ncbi:M56 family metallopeptidase [Anaerolentibacter hominis]|uniref:M56 family metallopeptidase n=1 Tax=Anaerolentibacter hominis TaxID=3079009 RepID=UPI0031B8930B
MESIFLKLLNMSITAGWLILAVMLLRVLLKRAPKMIRCILWGLVAVRLVCPFSVESPLSLIPSAGTVSPDIVHSQSPAINSGISTINRIINPVISSAFAPDPAAGSNPLQILSFIASIIWISGIAALLIYAAVSYIRLRRQVSASMCLRDTIWISDNIQTPFILGVLKPRIYLPSQMDDVQAASVIAHETAHLKRHDHWWKPLGFLLLTIYWFNPLIWAAYILLCRDIELACDERVVKEMPMADKKEYSNALLALSISRKTICACPLAFGETGVKGRIKSVLNYRKPTFWIIILSVTACIAAGVCFLTNPKEQDLPPLNLADADSPSDDHVSPLLTLDEVRALSEKGEALSWEDFDGFSYIETGSGLYIRVYEIDSLYSLWIGGGSTSDSPMYIYLQTAAGTDLEDRIDIRTDNVDDFIEKHRQDPLDIAVSTAILEHNDGYRNDGLIHVESHAVLATEGAGPADGSELDKITVYLLSMYHSYSSSGGILSEEGGSYVPLALTFTIDDGGAYILTEYWQPRDGSYYATDIRSRFPQPAAAEALDASDYAERQQQECYQKALVRLNAMGNIDEAVARLLDQITSLPSAASDPAEYVKGQPEAYDTLINYGEYTLRYCFTEFLKGGQTDLRGQIMALACRDIIAGFGETVPETDAAETGQDWFDRFSDQVRTLEKEIEHAELEKHYPAAWLLYELQPAE